jgi:hypothetical protein
MGPRLVEQLDALAAEDVLAAEVVDEPLRPGAQRLDPALGPEQAVAAEELAHDRPRAVERAPRQGAVEARDVEATEEARLQHRCESIGRRRATKR